MKDFHALRWGLAVFAVTASCVFMLARISTSRVATAMRTEVQSALDVMPASHFGYLGARMAIGMQMSHVAADLTHAEYTMELLSRLATASLEHPSGIGAFLLLREPSGEVIWKVPEAASEAEMAEPLATLEAMRRGSPEMMGTVIVDAPRWGRTLFLGFPTESMAGEQIVIVEAVLLDPFYDTLFKEYEARLGFEVRAGSTVVHVRESEPRAAAPFQLSRTFAVAGEPWTVTGWPHGSLVAAGLTRTWWLVVGVGLLGAIMAASLTFVVLKLWAAAASRRIEFAEARYREIVEGADEIILSVTPEGELIDANEATARMTGRSLQDVRGQPVDTLLAPESVPVLRQLLAAESASAANAVLNIRGADGTFRVVETTAHHRADASGADRIDLIGHNITERMQTEAALTAARDRAQETALLKAEFLANMSHEVRTPMHGILAMTDLLIESPLSPEQRELANVVNRCGENLLVVINDILDFSRIEANKLELRLETFDLEEVVSDAVAVVAARAQAKGLRLLSSIDPSLPRLLRGDPTRVRQVLINLIGNAVKFTDEGQVLIAAAPVGGAGSVRTVRFSVIDTGMGVPADRMHRLFQSFTQVDGSMTRRHGGAGLGLAISKGLVELMGGEIGAESIEGRGSTFWFTIPFEEVTAAREA